MLRNLNEEHEEQELLETLQDEEEEGDLQTDVDSDVDEEEDAEGADAGEVEEEHGSGDGHVHKHTNSGDSKMAGELALLGLDPDTNNQCVTTLNAAARGLAQVPDVVHTFAFLHFANLSNNQLTTLPPELCQLSHL